MTYPEFAKFDSTPEQDKALTIAFKTAVNTRQATRATTPGEFLLELVTSDLNRLIDEHDTGVTIERIIDRVKQGLTDVERANVARDLSIDLDIKIPSEIGK